MHSRFSYLAIASLATLAFSGCEWGGAHDDTWNDGYSWANFTGTYRFVKAVYYTPTASSSASDTSAKLKSVTDFAKETTYPVYNGQANYKMESQTSAGGSFSTGNGLVAGSTKITVSLKKGGAAVITSDSANNLIYKGQTVGSVTDTGTWGFTLPIKANAAKGDGVAVTYKYYGSGGSGGGSGGSGGSGSGGSGGSGSGSGGSSGGADNAVYLSFLKVTQQGNRLTMTGDNGIVYTGRLTGASTSKDGYVAAQQIRLSFEVSSANGMKITGHFSGQWSGASDKNYGVLSDRTIQGTHNRAGNFVGAAADTTIKVPDITISEPGVSSTGE